MGPRQSQARVRIAAILTVTLAATGTLALAAAGFAFARACGPGGDGVLARFDAPGGETVLVIQEWQDWAEPYTVSLFVRTPEGPRKNRSYGLSDPSGAAPRRERLRILLSP